MEAMKTRNSKSALSSMVFRMGGCREEKRLRKMGGRREVLMKR